MSFSANYNTDSRYHVLIVLEHDRRNVAWRLACIFPQQQHLIPQHAGGALVFKLKNAM